jgi:hypothetical protein
MDVKCNAGMGLNGSRWLLELGRSDVGHPQDVIDQRTPVRGPAPRVERGMVERGLLRGSEFQRASS